MKKRIILLAVLTIAMVSCNNNSNIKKNIEKVATSKETNVTNDTLNGEPILKYGYKFPGDCSATSLDWQGTYIGATANKENFSRLRLKLNEDWTFNLKIMVVNALESGETEETLQSETNGTFTFDSAGEIIKLIGTKHPVSNELISVKVKENYLHLLDAKLEELNLDGDMNALHKINE